MATETSRFSLAGKGALITGASSGLGRHFALTLARAGADVALAARREAALRTLAEDIAKTGRRAVPIAMDVTDGESVVEGVAQAWQALGKLDVLVNNAGISIPKFALDTSEEEWDRVLDANLKGAFLVAREVAKRMAARGQGGSIVNNASAVVFKVMKTLASYAASKGGLVSLTEALALEFARDGIRVNALAPGYFLTEINRDFFDTAPGAKLIERVPFRRLGHMEELEGALLLLASEAGSFMTGSVIRVDGGLSLN